MGLIFFFFFRDMRAHSSIHILLSILCVYLLLVGINILRSNFSVMAVKTASTC